jgi:hypothetical protein
LAIGPLWDVTCLVIRWSLLSMAGMHSRDFPKCK